MGRLKAGLDLHSSTWSTWNDDEVIRECIDVTALELKTEDDKNGPNRWGETLHTIFHLYSRNPDTPIGRIRTLNTIIDILIPKMEQRVFDNKNSYHSGLLIEYMTRNFYFYGSERQIIADEIMLKILRRTSVSVINTIRSHTLLRTIFCWNNFTKTR